MKNETSNKSMIIIGGGFAGLATGVYGRMNGYKTTIFEMHDLPGGLCTSWKRKGYTFDGCIHWLVGSSPDSGIHDLWVDMGIAQNRQFVNMDEYQRIENSDGRTLIFHTNIERLEKTLLDFSPQDAAPIKDFIDGIKSCLSFDFPSGHDPLIKRSLKQIKAILGIIVNGKKMKRWMNTTCEEFSSRFKDPMLREAFRELWIPEFSMLFMLFTFGYLHKRNAGYPIGGSLPMSEAMESRYKELGGIINYKSRVSKIITRDDTAVGILLEDGSEHLASRVVSAADGYSTLFNMLDSKYLTEKASEPYAKWLPFPPLVYVGLGVSRKFAELPYSVSGVTFHLKEQVMVAERTRDTLTAHIYGQDPTLAPEGKTAVTVMLKTDYEYWKKLGNDRKAYKDKKEEIGRTIIQLLEQRFPGISSQVEVIDVATPLTFERYTGNWKGSFEGWLITPENANTLMKPMSQTLPGLKYFYQVGQWVEPGGGLPTSVMSARRLMKKICREDGKKFIG